ncbi:probable integral membrane protein [Fulvimarina pelagi HTCC2506]|uniref:Small-conductance mechanosensitive channel n=1 Tax=Fulvimarina pelagi HTCC2506 TaxID=314231 RepID=Q0G5Y0_9HYPH|nr:mechanosensitive ion channel family protein [Fulvimarina pelagi]EAU42934.1 probable integral membrane protein [Fulvimarina pelagi HTCC2506]
MTGLFIPSSVADNIAWSICVLGACMAVRFLIERLAAASDDPFVARRRRFTVRALTNAIIAFALLGIWLAEIQNALLSLTAVLVALVVATKELIMCVAGSVLRFGGHLFKVGDRIEINGIHGEVVDHGLFSTTIMELPPQQHGFSGTGRTVMLPNSVLLSGPVKVEAQPRHYAPHRFLLTMEKPVPAAETARLVSEIARRVLEADRELAARFHQFAARKAGAEISGPETTVSVGTSEIGKMQFQITLYCLVRDAAQIQNEITVEVMDALRTASLSGSQANGEADDRAWADITGRLKQAAVGKRREAA